jgi:signal transduction histidine kinase
MGLIVALALVMVMLGTLARSAGREQLLSRDAELVEAIFLEEWETFRDTFALVGASLEPSDFLILATSAGDLRGVMGVAVYSPDGRTQWASFPDLQAIPLRESVVAEKSAAVHWHAQMRFEALYADWDPVAAVQGGDFVEVVVPALNAEGKVAARVQYWFEGSSLAAEFATLDRRILGQGLIVWMLVTGLVLVLGWIASRRMAQIGRELEAGRRSLEAANAELELAARASAVGAISAHLLHGLKNPLGGLRAYLRAQSGADEARSAADRMQRLIQETLQVLREEKRGGAPLAMDEFAVEMRRRLGTDSVSGAPISLDVQAETFGGPECAVGSFEARLVLLILENLVQNAVEASPYPVVVTVSAERTESDECLLRVADNGPGIPSEIRETLFEPGVRGRSEGVGAGLGLALSRHLARAMSGDLRLDSSVVSGAAFILRFPLQVGSSTYSSAPK